MYVCTTVCVIVPFIDKEKGEENIDTRKRKEKQVIECSQLNFNSNN
jgi:hypothetical protein